MKGVIASLGVLTTLIIVPIIGFGLLTGLVIGLSWLFQGGEEQAVRRAWWKKSRLPRSPA